ncbi:MAG: hypothetical protein ACPL4N_01700, partial [Candidatus Norongarragalinales archaeon]
MSLSFRVALVGVGSVVVLAALFLFFQQLVVPSARPASRLASVLPPAPETFSLGLGEGCVEGSHARYCESDFVLVLEECVGGSPVAQRFDCSEAGNSSHEGYCNADYVYSNGVRTAGCDLRERRMWPSASAPVFTASPSASPAFLQEFVQPFCGDGVCSVAEDCLSCVADCGCSASEYCDAAGLCSPVERCGDGNCSASEKESGSCCVDCGCASGELCAKPSTCFKPASINSSALNASVQSFVSGVQAYANYSVETVFDDFFNGSAVKVVELRCPG